jgi:hypothetical protein
MLKKSHFLTKKAVINEGTAVKYFQATTSNGVINTEE